MDASDQLYLIAQGVHRCVAARDAGLPGILAQIEQGGKKLGVRVLTLDCLVSPKAEIARWDRRRDFRVLVERMKTIEGRAGIGAVFVEPIPHDRASRFTRLLDVVVLDDAGEDQS